ncbi:MAG: hypothetical protein IPH11_04355 [Ignavibacteriales bacterium]|nr:hypothetical protein [Ignavibacteriales bacterium]
MKSIIFAAILLIPLCNLKPQGIGEFAPEKTPEHFPDNALGLDIMFGEGGLGFGGFYRRETVEDLTTFVDFSVSEAKDDREFQYVDYFGNTFTVGKKNRVFLLPLNFGVQYRVFGSIISDNLRPYINAAVGPVLGLTTPYEKEFFKAFGDTKTHLAFDGYVGFGANFGLDKKNLIGLNIRYYYTQFIGEGVESLEGNLRKSFSTFFITINFGFMY